MVLILPFAIIFPKKFLDTILLELRNNGILRSKKGPGGGYCLSRPASEITIGQAVRLAVPCFWCA